MYAAKLLPFPYEMCHFKVFQIKYNSGKVMWLGSNVNRKSLEITGCAYVMVGIKRAQPGHNLWCCHIGEYTQRLELMRFVWGSHSRFMFICMLTRCIYRLLYNFCWNIPHYYYCANIIATFWVSSGQMIVSEQDFRFLPPPACPQPHWHHSCPEAAINEFNK